MGKYISKSVLVEEIESRIKSMEECFNGKFPMSQSVKETEQDKGKLAAYKSILSFLDTLEVKEVDLDMKTFGEEMTNVFNLPSNETTNTEEEPLNWEYAIAKHFFELGMQASNPLTWEDIANINDIVSELLKECKDIILYDTQESFCKEVLKRFKAQKGEKV